MRKSVAVLMILAIMLVVGIVNADAAYYPKEIFTRFSATCGETITKGQMVALKNADGLAYKADANDSSYRPALGMAGTSCVITGSVEVVMSGIFGGGSALGEGVPLFLSETAGAITAGAPAYSQQVAFGISTTELYLNALNYFDTTAVTALGVLTGDTPIILEGTTANDYETTITAGEPTADNIITLPDATGTVLLKKGLGNLREVEITTATDILTSADCGKTIFLNSATEYVTTLPAVAGLGGCYFKIVVSDAPETASYTVVTNASANIIYGQIASAEDAAGSVVTTPASDTITFVDAKAIKGDYIEIITDGTSWYVSGMCNVQDGITTTQAT